MPEIIPDSNEAVLSYLKKSPRLALVNIADVADKTSVNSQLFFAQVGNAVSSVGDFFSGFFQDTDSNELSANLSGQISSSKQLVQYEGFQTLENQINQIIEQQSAALNENESQAVVSSQITERQRLLTEIQAKLDLFKIQAEELNQREKQLASLIPTQIFFSYDRVGGGGGSAIAISSSNDFQNSQTENQIIANNSTSTDESQTNNQAASLTETAPATIISPANHLVISEIQAGVDGNSNNEFVELYNPTDNAVNLSDWSLKRKTSQQATSTRNLVSDFGATSTIAAKSFFLIAHRDYSNYSTSTIPDLFYTNNSNPLAYDDDVVILYNGADEVIDEIYYQNIEVGKSWERKAVVNNQCATASSSNEFLGNGCDINSPLDFEIRGAPNPQNSQSFSEPRNAPTTPQNFAIKYSSSTMTLNFNWQESQDYNGATSTITYKITDISNNSSTLPEITAISTSASVVIDEIGRDYNFFIQAFDKEGLGSEIATSSISVPNFLSSLYFYKNSSVTNADYLIESFYDQYPFIPDVYQNGGNTSWKAMIFYLNSEAAKEIYLDSSFSSWYPWPQEIKDKILKIKYNTCAGGVGSPNYILILPDIKENCSVWGGLRNISFSYKYEDKNFAIAAVSSTIDTVFTANDYLTVAYYSFYSSGWWKGLPEVFRLAAVDKTKYYFGQSPIHQPPTSPSNLNAVFNATSSNLIINWDDSVDIDSLDSLIKYELNYHLDGEELDESKWQEVIKSGYQIRDDSGNLNPIIQTGPAISVSIVDSYKIYLRAKDEFGNYSEIISINWAYPVFLE